MSSDSQALTPDEAARIPFPLTETGYLASQTTYHGKFGNSLLFAQVPEGPWLLENGTEITPEAFITNLPNSAHISQLDLKTLRGTYQSRQVRFSASRGEWIYQNNHAVTFAPPTSRPPVTPAPAGPSHLPTPQSVGPALRSVPQHPPSPVHPQLSPVQTPVLPRPASPLRAPPQPLPPAAPPVNPAPRIMATPKLVGTAPEPFDGKPDKAEPFMYQLQNYYYLNEASFTDESRRVSAALTHFKAGTPAGDWAQDRTTTALARNPVNFGDWDTFMADYKKHFVPANTQLEAGALMHNLRQGNQPFNTWYQTWYTHAS
jgi:hypothetical protein